MVEIGYVVKPHSFKGALLLEVKEDVVEALSDIKYLFLSITQKPVPFCIESAFEKGTNRVVVKFEDINNEVDAKCYEHCAVFIQEELFSDLEIEVEESPFSDIVGFIVIDENYGEVGIIEEIIDMPLQEIAKVMIDDKEVLLPLNEVSIREIDQKLKILKYKAPDGLIEMYLE